VIWPAKTDIGGDSVINFDMPEHVTLRGDDRDASVDQGGHADIAIAIDRE
jgi:hypothetical protein